MVPFLLLRRLECRWPFRFMDRRGANVVSVALFGVRVVEVKAGQVRRELESHRLDHGTATIHWCAQIVATGGEVIREAEAVPTGATIGRTVEGVVGRWPGIRRLHVVDQVAERIVSLAVFLHAQSVAMHPGHKGIPAVVVL